MANIKLDVTSLDADQWVEPVRLAPGEPAAQLIGTEPDLVKATTATIRRKLITVPARVATSARRITLHLPRAWPWEAAWTALFDRVSDPPHAAAA